MVTEGEKLGNKGDFSGAVAHFKTAKESDPNLEINPDVKAKSLILGFEGRELADKGDFSGAVAKLKQALQLDPKIDLDPDTEGVQNNPEAFAKKLVASAYITQGKEFVNNNDIPGAIAKFKQALQLNREIDLDPDTEAKDRNPQALVNKFKAQGLITQAEDNLNNGDFTKAVAVYKAIEKLQPPKEILAKYWNILCLQGSLRGHAKDVVKNACEKAVKLTPKDVNILDSRGLARALTGDTQGAINDFNAFIESTSYLQKKAQRQTWVKDLQAGKKPFTPELLEKLRNQ
ncbi:MAG: tetratricopeptide repeat protein [Heteroscytonema crispum UTEX LB 1556]